MKNIIQKLKNFLNNSNNENIFLTNLVLTIISVPCLKFDNELIECNSILLNNDNSKFSLLTVLKYLVQELFKIIKKDEKNFEKNLKQQIEIIKKSEAKKNKKIIKIKKAGSLSLVNKTSEKDDQEIEYTNYIILFEFIKEFIYSITNKNNFEGLVENIYGFYSNLLEDYYQNEEEDVE
jgi:preprotein translocase subunit SecB